MKTLILVLTGMLVVATAAGRAQNPPAAPDAQPKMADQSQLMMPMMSMQAADKKLDDLVVQLNAARGNDRLDKVIAVVNELVAERKGMHAMMAGRGGMMMKQEAVTPKTDDHSAHHAEPGK